MNHMLMQTVARANRGPRALPGGEASPFARAVAAITDVVRAKLHGTSVSSKRQRSATVQAR
jgi:hypothetical protein